MPAGADLRGRTVFYVPFVLPGRNGRSYAPSDWRSVHQANWADYGTRIEHALQCAKRARLDRMKDFWQARAIALSAKRAAYKSLYLPHARDAAA